MRLNNLVACGRNTLICIKHTPSGGESANNAERRCTFAHSSSVPLSQAVGLGDDVPMGFNRRKMEDQRRQAAEKEAATRRATDAQVLEDAERLIAAWNERQGKRMPMLFSPTIGAPLPRAIGSYGCAVPLAEQSMRLICARSTVTTTRP